jgi:hypothetical protein
MAGGRDAGCLIVSLATGSVVWVFISLGAWAMGSVFARRWGRWPTNDSLVLLGLTTMTAAVVVALVFAVAMRERVRRSGAVAFSLMVYGSLVPLAVVAVLMLIR